MPIEKCCFLCYNTSEEKERKDGKFRWENKPINIKIKIKRKAGLSRWALKFKIRQNSKIKDG
jgi:hypothetical protein